MAIQNTLPNPSNGINQAGGIVSASNEPGYATVKVDSKFKTARDTTNSGVLISRSKAAQSFDVNITYNPLTEDEFMPVYSFLMEKQGMLKPFFVPLPQYDSPRDSTLAASGTINFSPITNYAAGKVTLTIAYPSYDSSTDGSLKPGDLITFNDSNDSNHLKAYKIVRVSTNATFEGTQPTITQQTITVSPPLQKDVSSSAIVIYKNPKIKVIQKSDVVSYSLGTDSLYKYSLSAMEVQ